jgi:hypothetical protein
VFGLPIDMFVKGGTSTMAHDRMVHEEETDAERRRDEQAAMRKVAAIPVEDGGAKLYTNYLAPNPSGLPMEWAKVLLEYLTAGGEQLMHRSQPVQCLADVIVGLDPLYPEELTLVLVCPECARRMPQGQCQIQIRQRNRAWYLDTRTSGDLVVFDDAPYRSAGMVMDSERFTCPRCAWAAHIDKNRVRSER